MGTPEEQARAYADRQRAADRSAVISAFIAGYLARVDDDNAFWREMRIDMESRLGKKITSTEAKND